MNSIESRSNSSSLPVVQLRAQDKTYEVQAILFDKDGTLLDFTYTWGSWGERLLASFSGELVQKGLPALRPELLSLWGIIYNESGEISGYDRNSPISMGTIGDLMSLLAQEGYQAGLSWAEAKMLAEQCRQEADEQLEASRTARLLPGAGAFLEQCRHRGILLGIVTSDETEAALKHLEWLGIRSYFDVCVGADLVDRGKPYPDMVELACLKLGVHANTTAVIGDTNGDMLMARAARAAAAIGIDEEGIIGKEGYPAAEVVIAGYLELRIS